jgi:uncharacterized protein involved in propanediol utilization
MVYGAWVYSCISFSILRAEQNIIPQLRVSLIGINVSSSGKIVKLLQDEWSIQIQLAKKNRNKTIESKTYLDMVKN